MKSFLWGVLAGAVLFNLLSAVRSELHANPFKYLKQPVSYEDKTETSFKVFQVFDHAALANEISDTTYNLDDGRAVLLQGEGYYSDQIVTINNPQRVGTYSYENNGGRQMTVPVIKGKEE